MNPRLSAVLLLAMLAGCASSGHRFFEEEGERGEEGELEMGPPPPGYWRIVGDAVPGWTPQSMVKHGDGPGMWTMVGPRPMTNEYWSGNANAGGRTTGIAVDPTDPNTVYIGTASGGVWKTTNGGTNWTPITDELSSLNHGAICIDPSNHNTIYAGTGEYQTSSGGDGIFRSTDAGATWTRIGTTAQVGSNISRIAVDPTNPLVIFVSGSLGLIRSTDGGTTWSNRLSGAGCSDMALNPANPQIVYAARHSDGIYKSTNGGTSFSLLGGGLPTSGLTRILLALAPSAPDTVYATIINTSSGLLGEYKTTNGGTNWTQLTGTPNFPSPQGGYDCFTIVHPTDPNTVYAGGVFPSYAVAGIIKTTNGGTNWTDVTIVGGTQVHPDMQTAAFGPDNTLWVGCDGGVWKTTNGAASWINCNATLAATQHYQIALHPTDPNNTIGGTQDNGTAQRNSASLGWPQILSGDGGFCCYDRTTPTRRYVTYVYLSVYRVSAGTTEISGPWSADPVQFIAPLVPDPNNALALLGGTNRVWRTTNATLSPPTWTAISTSAVGGGGTLSAIAVAQGASNTIYTGSSTGRVYQTTDTTTWSDRSAGLPGGNISDIVLNPTNAAVAYVSVSSSSGNRVLRTDTSGASWVNKTGTLPSGVRGKALAIDWRFTPPVMYVGTGVGIYWSFDDGATWTKDGADFPNVNIGDLKIDTTLLTITAGTYGRGVWRANLLTPPASVCYANCDDSTTPPILNVADFGCFLNRFALGDTYANCDGSTTPPTLNVQDFACFLNKFAAGCS